MAGDPGEMRGLARFRAGQRLDARVVRRLGGKAVLLEMDGTRHLAWLEEPVREDEALYLEVVSTWPAPRFRRLTGGGGIWSLPVGRSERVLDTEA